MTKNIVTDGIVSKVELNSRSKRYVRELVQQCGGDSVSLYLGNFATQEDLDRLIDDAIAIDFSTFSR